MVNTLPTVSTLRRSSFTADQCASSFCPLKLLLCLPVTLLLFLEVGGESLYILLQQEIAVVTVMTSVVCVWLKCGKLMVSGGTT